MSFPKKTPDEIKLLTFYFKKAPTGAILSNATVISTILVDPGNSPANVTISDIIIAGAYVVCLAANGQDGGKYRIRCEVDLDNGEHHVIEKDLPVRDNAALVR